MQKTLIKKGFVIILALLIIGIMVPLNSSANKQFTYPHEGAHFSSKSEWFCFCFSLRLDDGSHWDICFELCYKRDKNNNTKCFPIIAFWDRTNNDAYYYSFEHFKDKNISFNENKLFASYYNSSMEGIYPNYYVTLQESQEGLGLNLDLNAISEYHWALQDSSQGYFPWWANGLGRYAFIPVLNVNGSITINSKKINVSGIGYYEHVWGNFSFILNPENRNFKEKINYLQKTWLIAKWFINEQKSPYNGKKEFSKESFLGYDWIWGVFDNGWSVWGNIFHYFDFIIKGPSLGIITLLPDGKTFWEFGDIDLIYSNWYYVEEADMYLPLGIKLLARKDDKMVVLYLSTICNPWETHILYPASSFSCGFTGVMTASVINGYYTDPEQNVSLNGYCSLGLYRKNLNFESLKLRNQLNDFFRNSFNTNKNSDFILPYYNENYFNGSILYVGGNGLNNYSSIQEAVDAAEPGDVVYVFNGTYRENIVVNKTIKLLGEDKIGVKIYSGHRDGILLTADEIEVSGFSIDSRDADDCWDSAIDIKSNNNFIHDVNIINSNWYGIFVENCSFNQIEFVNITGNYIGIWLCRSDNNIISNNTFISNKIIGLWLWPSSKNNIIISNNFINNSKHALNQDSECINIWDRNFWDNNFILKSPYRIFNLRYDWHPAQKPYS